MAVASTPRFVTVLPHTPCISILHYPTGVSDKVCACWPFKQLQLHRTRAEICVFVNRDHFTVTSLQSRYKLFSMVPNSKDIILSNIENENQYPTVRLVVLSLQYVPAVTLDFQVCGNHQEKKRALPAADKAGILLDNISGTVDEQNQKRTNY